jgi:hypothetical protein
MQFFTPRLISSFLGPNILLNILFANTVSLSNGKIILDFAFRYFAVYVQRRLIFSRRFLFIVTICFGPAGHHHVMQESAAHCNAVLQFGV